MRHSIVVIFALVVFLVSCQKEPGSPMPSLKFTESEVMIDHGSTHTLSVDLTGIDGDDPIVWGATNDFYASISQSGVVTAKFVGSTKIHATHPETMASDTCIVNITATVSAYMEPYISWGGTKAEVIDYETREMLSESDDSMMFRGENSGTRFVIYLFEQGKLTGSAVLVTSTWAAIVMEHLLQRYMPIVQYQGYFYFESPAAFVAMGNDTSLGWHVMYVNGSDKDTEQMIEKLKKKI